MGYWYNLLYGTGVLLFCLVVCLVGASKFTLNKIHFVLYSEMYMDLLLNFFRSLCENLFHNLLFCDAVTFVCNGKISHTFVLYCYSVYF